MLGRVLRMLDFLGNIISASNYIKMIFIEES